MNNSGIVYNPRLIEPGVKSFISSTLKDCRRLKDNHETVIFNISMFIIGRCEDCMHAVHIVCSFVCRWYFFCIFHNYIIFFDQNVLDINYYLL